MTTSSSEHTLTSDPPLAEENSPKIPQNNPTSLFTKQNFDNLFFLTVLVYLHLVILAFFTLLCESFLDRMALLLLCILAILCTMESIYTIIRATLKFLGYIYTQALLLLYPSKPKNS